VTGTVEAGKLTRRETARAGDVLLLTKPLGTGVLGFARQVGRAAGDGAAALEWMAALNRSAAEAAAEAGAGACTDVTGFGLFGHLIGMARHSGVTAEIWAEELPALAGAAELLAEGVVPGAVERNREYVGQDIAVAAGVDEARVLLGFDAQTSGGLLMCVQAARVESLKEGLARRGARGWVIGRITEPSDGRIIVSRKPNDRDALGEPCCQQGPQEAECCAEGHDTDATCLSPQSSKGMAPGTTAGEAFAALMKAASAPGRLDARTKELIEFALVVHARCPPCVAAHLKKAREMGITQEELDEAAWCAVVMGGAPVRMFYLEAARKG
jgi:AhpD family alkylhydroperoxidase